MTSLASCKLSTATSIFPEITVCPKCLKKNTPKHNVITYTAHITIKTFSVNSKT